jgi:hypothetical protein
MTETALATRPEKIENVFLSARNSQELSAAKEKLATWLKAKIDFCEREATGLRKSAEHAKKMKWQHKPLLSAFSREMQRVTYYEKMLQAVEAGYTIIPWNWMDVFAVRVNRETPKRGEGDGADFQAAINRLPDAKGENLKAGVGRYVGDSVIGTATAYTKTENGKEITRYSAWPTDFTEVDFPVMAAKPELMNATAAAMALKIFDEIGVAPNRRGRDPLILGTIKGPGYVKQHFLIAWYLDTRAL